MQAFVWCEDQGVILDAETIFLHNCPGLCSKSLRL